jgi:hypothetical protein
MMLPSFPDNLVQFQTAKGRSYLAALRVRILECTNFVICVIVQPGLSNLAGQWPTSSRYRHCVTNSTSDLTAVPHAAVCAGLRALFLAVIEE